MFYYCIWLVPLCSHFRHLWSPSAFCCLPVSVCWGRCLSFSWCPKRRAKLSLKYRRSLTRSTYTGLHWVRTWFWRRGYKTVCFVPKLQKQILWKTQFLGFGSLKNSYFKWYSLHVPMATRTRKPRIFKFLAIYSWLSGSNLTGSKFWNISAVRHIAPFCEGTLFGFI